MLMNHPLANSLCQPRIERKQSKPQLQCHVVVLRHAWWMGPWRHGIFELLSFLSACSHLRVRATCSQFFSPGPGPGSSSWPRAQYWIFKIYFHRETNSGSFLFDPRKSESMIVVACCPLLIYDELSRPSFVSVLIKEMSLEDDVLSHGQIVAAFWFLFYPPHRKLAFLTNAGREEIFKENEWSCGETIFV